MVNTKVLCGLDLRGGLPAEPYDMQDERSCYSYNAWFPRIVKPQTVSSDDNHMFPQVYVVDINWPVLYPQNRPFISTDA